MLIFAGKTTKTKMVVGKADGKLDTSGYRSGGKLLHSLLNVEYNRVTLFYKKSKAKKENVIFPFLRP